jgi:small subunit ribosomal protein S5
MATFFRGDTIVNVDRVNKVQRGGTMVRYRCLVIGGNTRGCAGYGIGKADSPREATDIALRKCKQNVFFVDRFRGSGLSRDLVGRHNSCKVILRAVEPNQGLNGHPLVMDILTYFGITDCVSKTHGNRNVYSVVRATFKAIMTHESMEEIALKRGKRLISLERAARLQI